MARTTSDEARVIIIIVMFRSMMRMSGGVVIRGWSGWRLWSAAVPLRLAMYFDKSIFAKTSQSLCRFKSIVFKSCIMHPLQPNCPSIDAIQAAACIALSVLRYA